MVTAENMHATNVNMQLQELKFDFLEEETLEQNTQPSFVVNGVTVNPNQDPDDD